MPRIRSLLRAIWHRNRLEQDMSEEMQFHLAARTDDLMRRGLTQSEAVRQARLEFGTVDSYKEEVRQSRGLRWMDELVGNLRYAWRQICKTPAFSILAGNDSCDRYWRQHRYLQRDRRSPASHAPRLTTLRNCAECSGLQIAMASKPPTTAA